jgi:membrane protease YdiL (CAAX protease family)
MSDTITAGDAATQARAGGINWRTFWTLTAAGVVGALAILPAVLTAQADLLKDIPVPLWVVLPLQTLQNAVLIGVAVAVGLWLGGKTGLGAPLVDAWLGGARVRGRLARILLPSLASGLVVGAAVIALDEVVFSPRIPQPALNLSPTPFWQDLLAGLYGGITEELLMRLGLFTVFAWLFAKLSRAADLRPSTKALWGANFVVAILFGLGHLPATAYVMTLTPLVVLRAVALNGIAGLTFGYLYWKRGLESAMLAHLTTDVMLMTVVRFFVS